MARDFKALLEHLKTAGNPVTVAIPQLGLITAKILDIQEDVVSLESNLTQPNGSQIRNVLFLHYTSVIVVT